MITIRIANKDDATVLALLGRITYVESHGHFIENKNDLARYCDKAFSTSKTSQDLADAKNIYFIVFANDFPVGYAKLVRNAQHNSISSKNCCRLERIYVLNEFIPLKIGQQLLTHVEQKTKELQIDTIWLSVYIKNDRAIRFYQKNNFTESGKFNFLVNGIGYENLVLSKKIEACENIQNQK